MKIRILTLVLIVGFVSTLFACNTSSDKKKESNSDGSVVEKEEVNPLDTFKFSDFNSVARILAGKLPDNEKFLTQIIESQKFTYHKSSFDNVWTKHSEELDKIANWSEINLSHEDTIFYPFGGPDFNYMDAFFPDCRFSVMIGLEKGGKIPFSDSLSVANYDKILDMVNKTIVTNVGYSFFRTKSMRNDLAGYLEGTLPIVMLFMSRHDYDIVNINPVFINNQGEFEYTNKDDVYSETMTKDFQDAYEVVYKKPTDDYYRKLYYLSMDVSDSVINEQSFTLMMQNYFKDQTTFMKASSYLLDMEGFETIKKLILDNSKQILTGPSGMQYRFLDNTWDIELYGNYIGPIRLFGNRPQNDLKEAYKNGNPKPIDFLYDYHTGAPSLLIAKKK